MRITFNSYLPQITVAIENNIEAFKRAIGEFVATEAKIRAPYDTGLLESSIDYDASQKNLVRIGTPVEYGKYQEFGTKYLQAQPFLEPAVYENVERIKQLAATKFGDGFK